MLEDVSVWILLNAPAYAVIPRTPPCQYFVSGLCGVLAGVGRITQLRWPRSMKLFSSRAMPMGRKFIDSCSVMGG